MADKDNLPVTAAGMVAYKSGSNGLVIALADESSEMNWNTANGASGAAAHNRTVTGQTWKLPSKAEWELMFSANDTGLNTAITAAGGTALALQNSQNDNYYWSSTEFDSGKAAYLVELFSGGSANWTYGSESSLNKRVRACFAF